MQFHVSMNRHAGIKVLLLLILSFLVFIAAVWWLVHERNSRMDEVGVETSRPQAFQSRPLAREMDEINNMLQQAQERWKSGASHESILEQLEAIKVRLSHIKNDSAPALQEQYSELVKRTDDIITGIRERMDAVGDLFNNLMSGFQDVRNKLMNSSSHTTSSRDEEEEYEAHQYVE